MNEETSAAPSPEFGNETRLEKNVVGAPECQSVLLEKKTPEKIRQRPSHAQFREVLFMNTTFILSVCFFETHNEDCKIVRKDLLISLFINQYKVLFYSHASSPTHFLSLVSVGWGV